MPDVSNLKVGQNTYSLKDATARTQAQTAQTTATQAQSAANEAQTTAENALTQATETDDKLTNKTLEGVYTASSETLEYQLKIGVGG